MGSIEPYETSGGRRYRVRYRDPEHRSREKAGFRHKTGPGSATEFLASVTVDMTRGDYIEPAASRVTVSRLGPQWLDAQAHLKPSSAAPLEGAWRVYVEPRWGRTPISRIRHSDVQAWIGELRAGTAPTTRSIPRALGASSVIRCAGVIAGILDVAVKDRRISSNPARGVNLPRKTGKRHIYLSHAQVELLAQNCGQHATLVRFLCYTGLRWGEAIALRVRDLDMFRRRVEVVENAVRVNAKIIVGTPKSHRSRIVLFPKFLVMEIARQCEGRSREDLLFGNGKAYLNQPTAHGGWYRSAIAKARAVDPTFPSPTIHDLRHTAASLAISAGANVKAVQRMLGHASAAMTLDVYADLFEEDLDAVTVALDKARSESVGFLWWLGNSDPSGGTLNTDLTRENDDDETVPPLGFEPRLCRF